jgi:hypothetical protein
MVLRHVAMAEIVELAGALRGDRGAAVIGRRAPALPPELREM